MSKRRITVENEGSLSVICPYMSSKYVVMNYSSPVRRATGRLGVQGRRRGIVLDAICLDDNCGSRQISSRVSSSEKSIAPAPVPLDNNIGGFIAGASTNRSPIILSCVDDIGIENY